MSRTVHTMTERRHARVRIVLKSSVFVTVVVSKVTAAQKTKANGMASSSENFYFCIFVEIFSFYSLSSDRNA